MASTFDGKQITVGTIPANRLAFTLTAPSYLEFSAAGSLSALRFVILTPQGITYANSSNVAHAFAVLGITLTAATAAGQLTKVQRFGEVDLGVDSLVANQPFFLSDAGALTQVYPSASSFVLVLGRALDTRRILLNMQQPIFQV